MTPLDLDIPMPGTERWQILRAGIQNLWEYDDQRFTFHRGRLLLRGQNESGKTKALEVLLPFVLDASLLPSRLDPFGSTSRPMYWNLISDRNPEVNLSIGYVWLELGRLVDGEPIFCTIGAGLRARRSSREVDAWYFRTSQRIDRDLRLVDSKIPLDRPALTKAIDAHGQVYQQAGDYRRAVNDELFGMEQEQYGALIDALLQLRRPQLSKRLDPDELSKILTASLPPLDRSVIGSLAEGFERLDRHRNEREDVATTLASLRRFLKVYKAYVSICVKGAAKGLTSSESAYHAAREELRLAEGAVSQLEAAHSSLIERIRAIEEEEQVLAARLETLRSSEEYRAVENLARLETEAKREQERAEKDRRDLDEARGQLAKTAAALGAAAADLAEQEPKAEAARRKASAAAGAAILREEHSAIDELIGQGELAAAQSAIESLRQRREQHIAALRKLERELREAKRKQDLAAQRLLEARNREVECRERLVRAEVEAEEAGAQLAAAIVAWAEGLEVLSLDLAALRELSPLETPEVVRRAESEAREALGDRLTAARIALEKVSSELEATRLEHDALASRSHRPPQAPPWRTPRAEDRPGAPLYLLCDFVEGLSEAEQGAIEGALEASGLLDAWVDPAGALLDAGTFDLMLTPAPREGRTLLEVLRPVEGAVPSAMVEAALRSIEWTDDVAGEGSCWISKAGRFRMGALLGANRRESAQYVGTTARERARQRRLEELQAKIALLDLGVAERQDALARLQRRQVLLGEELSRFPELQPLREARAVVASEAKALEREGAFVREAAEVSQRAEAAAAAARDALHAEGSRLGLLDWVERLADLERASRDWATLGKEAVDAGRWLGKARTDHQTRMEEHALVETSVESASNRAEGSAALARKAKAAAETMHQMLGATRDELLLAIDAAEGRQKACAEERRAKSASDGPLREELGKARGAVESQSTKVSELDSARQEAERAFRAIAERRFLDFLELDAGKPVETWSFTDALQLARRADEATGSSEFSQEVRDRALNRVHTAHSEVQQGMRGEIRIVGEQSAGVLEYKAKWSGRSLDILELERDLETDLRARDELLGREENEVFEEFLSGETHKHLRDRLRDAGALVKKMNDQLEARPTSSGMRMRLKWESKGDAPTGTREAIDLLLRSSHLLSEADRGALRSFLQQRLAEARTEDGAGSLEERMMLVLDYRGWFEFHADFTDPNGNWKRLNRKSHGAGSGGQKAVMLHLPLFAAAAAFFESASKSSLRLIVLDEAFAGIDRPTRGALMGLLAEFDLDFVMTSFEEWGFFPQLDGLSTYHLAREKGMPGVYSERFVWDGKEARQVSA